MLVSHKGPGLIAQFLSFFLPLIQKVKLFVQDILNMNPLSFYLSTCSSFFKSSHAVQISVKYSHHLNCISYRVSIENLVSNRCKYQMKWQSFSLELYLYLICSLCFFTPCPELSVSVLLFHLMLNMFILFNRFLKNSSGHVKPSLKNLEITNSS